jgi:NADH-quinone oxidoreductase subunit L
MLLSIIGIPFIAFLIAGFISIYFVRSKRKSFLNFISWLLTTIGMGVVTLVSIVVMLEMMQKGETIYIPVFSWFISGNFLTNIVFVFDVAVLVMICVVAFISFMVHIYSYFYLDKTENIARFQAYLSFFTFSMLFFVISDNLLQAFIGWELISFCSYLLISFWFKLESANYASMKAFLINRFADIAFLLGIFVVFALFGSLRFEDINNNILKVNTLSFEVLGFNVYLVTLAGVLFITAAFAKSAQLGLHIWLPDAMEAPTPVSALLHAATMVTAGVFLLVKLSAIYAVSQFSSDLILIVSGFTALYAAIVACVQNDIKKIIAYSTISQIAYMFLSIGVGYYNIAIFHLVTHAFFKSLLFLCAGAVIHNLSGEQDIRNMGGLWRKLPITYVTMAIGLLALIGVPGFAGFYSKEAIINVLYLSNNIYAKIAFVLAISSVFFTAFYSLRVFIKVFHGEPLVEYKTNISEHSFGISFVLVVLSIFSIFIGKIFVNDFIGANIVVFWKKSFLISEDLVISSINHLVEVLSLAIIIITTIIIYIIYIREKNFSVKLSKTFPIIYKILLNKFYFDFVYDVILVKGISKLGKSLQKFDDNLLDKYGPNTIPALFYRIAKRFYKMQNGNVNFYAFIMVLGLFLILSISIFIFKDLF